MMFSRSGSKNFNAQKISWKWCGSSQSQFGYYERWFHVKKICKNSKHKKSWKCRCSLSTIIMFFTSSNSPSALTTVSVFRFVFSSKCGGEYPGNALLVWLLSSFVKGFTSTSGDSSSPLRSTIVLWSKSRSWDDTSLDRWTLSSTERRVMEDLKVQQISNIFLASSFEA